MKLSTGLESYVFEAQGYNKARSNMNHQQIDLFVGTPWRSRPISIILIAVPIVVKMLVFGLIGMFSLYIYAEILSLEKDSSEGTSATNKEIMMVEQKPATPSCSSRSSQKMLDTGVTGTR